MKPFQIFSSAHHTEDAAPQQFTQSANTSSQQQTILLTPEAAIPDLLVTSSHRTVFSSLVSSQLTRRFFTQSPLTSSQKQTILRQPFQILQSAHSRFSHQLTKESQPNTTRHASCKKETVADFYTQLSQTNTDTPRQGHPSQNTRWETLTVMYLSPVTQKDRANRTVYS
ncbi:hypothetical protein V1264_008125 [Littorina saxatilis]|uniref:Uncharacterized protein n=1 Tax=Littorina saxatilis TaxID=31220 RepID=A0AAN9G1Z6_9CAEN